MCEATLRHIEVICNISITKANIMINNPFYRLILCWMDGAFMQTHFMHGKIEIRKQWFKSWLNKGICMGKALTLLWLYKLLGRHF